jgi:hypothetical protein
MVVRLRVGQVTFDPGEPKAFIHDERGPVVHDLTRRMTRVAFQSRKLVRVRTGKLLSTIEVKPPGHVKRGPYVEVWAGRRGMRYTMAEHDGTAPHIIRARRRKALRFTAGGQVLFRRQVHHPGTTGTLYLTMALPYGAI